MGRGQNPAVVSFYKGGHSHQGDDREPQTVYDEVPEDLGPAPSTIAQAGGPRGPNKPPR